MGSDPTDLKSTEPANNRWLTVAVFLAVILLVLLGLSRLDPNVWASRERLQNLIYFGLLLVVISPLFFTGHISKNLRHIALWAIALMVLAYGYTVWRTDKTSLRDFGGALAPQHNSATIVGEAQFFANRSGDFVIIGFINDVEVSFLVDTGASDVILTTRDAERLGIVPDDMIFSRLYRTANGTVAGAPVRLSAITVGGVRINNVRASVTDGALHKSLLGMSYLSRLSEFSVKGQVLTFYQ